MLVLKPSERSGDLDIAKSDTVRERVMLGNPALSERADSHDQLGTIAVRERLGRMPNFDPLPRRKEPLERAGTSMPSE